MSSGSEKVAVGCPSCNKRLLVPAAALGKQGRCPECQSIFTLEQLFEADSVAGPGSHQFTTGSGDYQLQPTTSTEYAAANPYASPQVTQVSPPYQAYQAAPQAEKGPFWSSFLGGVSMMVIAVVWFFGAAFFGVYFIYPPIMFIIGAVVAVKGLVSGNIMG